MKLKPRPRFKNHPSSQSFLAPLPSPPDTRTAAHPTPSATSAPFTELHSSLPRIPRHGIFSFSSHLCHSAIYLIHTCVCKPLPQQSRASVSLVSSMLRLMSHKASKGRKKMLLQPTTVMLSTAQARESDGRGDSCGRLSRGECAGCHRRADIRTALGVLSQGARHVHQVERRRPWTRLLWFEDQTENSSCSCFKTFFYSNLQVHFYTKLCVVHMSK